MMMQKGQASLVSTVASAAEMPNALRVDLYQLQVPQGTVSRNEKFWKRVDEHSLDPETYELLFKNGVRVGQAPIAEWDYFRAVMEQYPAITKGTSMVAAENKPIELSMCRDIPGQEIFYFNSSDELEGRSFDACENIIAVTFQQAPRQANTMRVAMCPTVRCVHKRLELSPLNNEVEVSYTAPERLYDLNLRTDVPLDNFLIVAPSAEASRRRTSIGNHFFITQGTAERMENVLLIVPRPIRIIEEATPAPRASAK